ncbi:MAG: SH3 domain-containing protein [Chloroflexi bacterium]|nr:SH3 domain-containing protein [Chloroflexota bacterium]
MIVNRVKSFPILIVIVALLGAALACTLVSEDTVTDDERLVSDERPSLLLLAPLNQSVYAAGAEVNFHILARDTVGVYRVEVEINVPGEEVLLEYRTDDPEGVQLLDTILAWEATGEQTYLATARAFRPAGDPNDPLDDIPSNEVAIAFQVVPPPEMAPPADISSPEPQASVSPTSGALEDLEVFPASISSALPVPVRQGPGTNYAVIRNLDPQTTIDVVGRSADEIWLVIQLDGGTGWVFRDVVDFGGDITSLPVVQAP